MPAPVSLCASVAAETRMLNATVFAALVGVASWLLMTTIPAAQPQLLFLSLMWIPALPFFAMQVSDSGLVHSFYPLFAASAMAVVLGTRRSEYVGLALGLAVALMIGTARAAWPMVPLIGTTVFVAVLLPLRRPRWASIAFWVGLAGGLALRMRRASEPIVLQMQQALPDKKPNQWVTLTPWVTEQWWLPASVAATGILAEAAFLTIRNRISPVAHATYRVIRWSFLAGAASVLCSLLASLAVRFPTLITLENSGVSLSTYLASALGSAIGTFRLGEPDFLLFSSLMGGFGWLDTIPPQWFFSVLVLLTAGCAVGFLVRAAREAPLRVLISMAIMWWGRRRHSSRTISPTFAVAKTYRRVSFVGISVCWGRAGSTPALGESSPRRRATLHR